MNFDGRLDFDTFITKDEPQLTGYWRIYTYWFAEVPLFPGDPYPFPRAQQEDACANSGG